eukprot:277176_1
MVMIRSHLVSISQMNWDIIMRMLILMWILSISIQTLRKWKIIAIQVIPIHLRIVMATERSTHIYSYGPYRSAFGHIIEECFVKHNPIVLIGTGAGATYILDFLLYSRAHDLDAFETRVDIHFSC